MSPDSCTRYAPNGWFKRAWRDSSNAKGSQKTGAPPAVDLPARTLPYAGDRFNAPARFRPAPASALHFAVAMTNKLI